MDYDKYCEHLLNNFIDNHPDYFPKYVYKYYDFNGGYLSLKNRTIQFTNPLKFEDKSECRVERIQFKNQGKRIKETLLSEEIKRYDYKILGYNVDTSEIEKSSYRDIEKKSEKHWNELIQSFGVTCFTLLEDSDFHWVNYADNEKGLCIKYDFHALINYINSSSIFEYNGKKSIIHSPVIYVDDIQAIKYGETSTKKLLMQLNRVFVKEKAYENEVEYRLYSQNCKIENGVQRVNISKESILQVKFGKNVSNEDIQKVKKLGF
ncbi:DUF2971 domain-containing protein [Sphingobacterium bovistauri]|uniref:DUF2971 domain-containing protein n=1 Tax=Sphingobacterium bovistauri TaxID=2781959 RepID=A0ABS7Z913_9SPHI|nr:DUF2971 domain-containing protein [Sphingobacterium bovistauri]MCA5006681.1 DUF2971 domain-containing protein [Sphingobacterium bovistauri]